MKRWTLKQSSLAQENRRLKEELELLKAEVHRDDLTGLRNAKSMRRELAKLVEQRQEQGETPALIFMDLDFFKEVNEQHGHVAAGLILGQVGARIAEHIRKSDVAFRYGGDEFVVLVNGGLKSALKVSERLRKAVANKPFRVRGLKGLRDVSVTASLGLKVVEAGWELREILEAADRAMFQAKRKSRNTVVAA